MWTSIFTFTPRALYEKVDKIQKSHISVLFVRLNPVINNGLKSPNEMEIFIKVTDTAVLPTHTPFQAS